MKRFAVIVLALATLPSSVGCTTMGPVFGLRDLVVFQDFAIENRNKNEAYKAWKRARVDYWRQGVPHYLREHIGRGFQQGFADAAAGGGQELPYFPPRSYWGPAYQTPLGNEMIAAWFRGYSDGAMAGEQSGLTRYLTLPSSSSVPMPKGKQVEQQPGSNNPYDFLPPNFLNDSEEIPKTPQLNEPLPPPFGGSAPPATKAPPIPEKEPVKLQPPPVPGKQTSTPNKETKPAVLPATPILEVDAAAVKAGQRVR
jgi:hypothetical protein